MGVSSTRVGDHRGSARTVQFLSNFFHDHPHSEVRAFRRIPHFPHTSHKYFGQLSYSCATAGSYCGRFGPFSSIVFLSFPGWQWSAFSVGSIPSQPLHVFLASPSPSPSYIFISSPRPHISFPIDKSKCLHTLSSAACPILKSPLFLFVYFSTAHFYTCFSFSSFIYIL